MSRPAIRWRRVVTVSLVALAALAAASVPAWRALFAWARDSGRLAAWANPRPERVRITWERVASPWPGWFEVENLRVAGRTPRLAWEVTAGTASGVLDPTRLLFRELAFTRLRARGVAVHSVRFAVAARAAATPGAVPEVAGFTAPPPPAPPPPRLPWSFSFADLEVEGFGELWVDDRRYAGTARGHGGFALRRRALAEVFASTVEFRDVALVANGHAVANGVAGRLDFHVLPWRYAGATALAIARRFEGRLRLAGEVAPEEVLAYLFEPWPWLELETAPSRIEADLRLHAGSFASGSRVSIASAQQTLRFLDFEARGRATLEAHAEGGWPGRVTLTSTLRLDDWQLGRHGEPPFLKGDGLRVEANADRPEIDHVLGALGLALDLGEARLPDLTFLNESIPSAAGVLVERGSARVAGALHFTPGPGGGDGTVTVRATDLALRLGDGVWSGDVEADLHLSEPAFRPASFALAGSRLLLRNLVAPAPAGDAQPTGRWWGELALPEGRVVLARPFRASGRFAARLADSRPLVRLYELKRDLPEWAERLLTLEGLSIGGRYDWQAGRLALDDVVAPLPHGEVRATLGLERDARRGRLLVIWRGLAAGLELAPEGRRLHLRGARAWFAGDGVPGADAAP